MATLLMLKWPSLSIETYFRRMRAEMAHAVAQVPPIECRGENWGCGRGATGPLLDGRAGCEVLDGEADD